MPLLTIVQSLPTHCHIFIDFDSHTSTNSHLFFHMLKNVNIPASIVDMCMKYWMWKSMRKNLYNFVIVLPYHLSPFLLEDDKTIFMCNEREIKPGLGFVCLLLLFFFFFFFSFFWVKEKGLVGQLKQMAFISVRLSYHIHMLICYACGCSCGFSCTSTSTCWSG